MIAKGLGILSLGSMGVGGMALTHPGLFKVKRVSPPDLTLECHSLSEDSDFDTTYSEGNKFGKKYKNYLVGVTNRETEDNKYDIKKWWEWAFKRLSVEKPDKGKFKDVEAGYGNENKHLSKVCKDAYGTEESNFDETNDDKFKKSEVWEYCSIGGTLPKTVKEFNVDKGEYEENYGDSSTMGAYRGSEDSYSKLLSLQSDDNEWIWDIKGQEFFSDSNTITEEGYFKLERYRDINNRKTIQKICENAYVRPENIVGPGTDKITKTDTIKYCSLEGMVNLTSEKS